MSGFDGARLSNNEKDACAELLGVLLGRVETLSRLEAGSHNALALTYAYRVVAAELEGQLRKLAVSAR